jgi:hypothetical protein
MTEINNNYFAPSNNLIFEQKLDVNPITPNSHFYNNNKYLAQMQGSRITPINEVKAFNNFR